VVSERREGRDRLEDYKRSHEADPDAHGRMRREFEASLMERVSSNSTRISRLEAWQQRITGALLLLAFLLGGGGSAAVIELVRK
jgi:hypothetical protein